MPRFVLGRARGQHADVLLHDARLAIDDERGRQRADAREQLLDLRRHHHHRVVDLVLGGEAPDDVDAASSSEMPITCSVSLYFSCSATRSGISARHGPAPGRPEVDDHDFAAQRRGEMSRPSRSATTNAGAGVGLRKNCSVTGSPSARRRGEPRTGRAAGVSLSTCARIAPPPTSRGRRQSRGQQEEGASSFMTVSQV